MSTRPRLWHELDMLCRLGLGLAPIAPDVCRLLCALVGADEAALFWVDEHGLPEGFFHEGAPAAVQDLFLNEFERLFQGAGETNVVALAQADGPAVGRLLSPDARYFRSNTYNLLIRACGHHHTLDLRVEAQGRTRAVALLFRTQGRGFGPEHVALLSRASASLQRAFARAPAPCNASKDGPEGHVLLDATSFRPVLADATAMQLLQDANLRGLGLRGPAGGPLPPNLAWQLGLRLHPRHGFQPSEARIPVPHGLLAVRVHALRSPAVAPTAPPAQWLLTLQLQRPQQIDVVRRVLQLPLSPLQREIAALAGLGHARAEATTLTGVGSAALKKHMRLILEATGASDWEELASRLQHKNAAKQGHSPYTPSANSY